MPRESFPNVRRVALTPQNTALLLKKDYSRVIVERGAGAEAQFTDDAYKQAGATLVCAEDVWQDSNIVLKVRSPNPSDKPAEIVKMRQSSTVISFLYRPQNKPIVEALAQQKVTSFAMDMAPRISRAQVFDA